MLAEGVESGEKLGRQCDKAPSRASVKALKIGSTYEYITA